MTHVHRWTRLTSAHLIALLVSLGCGGDSSVADKAIDETLAGRLVGAWDLQLELERPLSLSTDAKTLPQHAVGTMAVLEASSEPLSFEGMSRPTHIGVYQVDLGVLGFPSNGGGAIPDLAARVVGGARGASALDSVYIVLTPETPRYSIRLSGTFDANGAAGTWIAESFLGGGGTFVMRRR